MIGWKQAQTEFSSFFPYFYRWIHQHLEIPDSHRNVGTFFVFLSILASLSTEFKGMQSRMKDFAHYKYLSSDLLSSCWKLQPSDIGKRADCLHKIRLQL